MKLEKAAEILYKLLVHDNHKLAGEDREALIVFLASSVKISRAYDLALNHIYGCEHCERNRAEIQSL